MSERPGIKITLSVPTPAHARFWTGIGLVIVGGGILAHRLTSDDFDAIVGLVCGFGFALTCFADRLAAGSVASADAGREADVTATDRG